MLSLSEFDPNCKDCPRLSEYLQAVRTQYPAYHAGPVAPFGADNPRLLIVGLAPGMHGANATGRPFTGDHAGILLYETLHKYRFSNRPQSRNKNDGLKLIDCRITNAVKCLPPQNKPNGQEVRQCNNFLREEIRNIKGKLVILALGRIAHDAVLKALELKEKDYPFKHHACHMLADGRWLLDSYHCSRYNTQTKRLTEEMFYKIFDEIHALLDIAS